MSAAEDTSSALVGAAPEQLSILRPIDQRLMATKEYFIAADGRVLRREFGSARHFSVELAEAHGIDELHRLLEQLENDARAFVIRGAPKASTNLARTARTLRKDGGAFADVPRAWLMLDADKVKLPAGFDVVADPEDVARHLAELFGSLAPDLDGVTCIVQFSSSAGIAEVAEAEQAAGLPERWGSLAKPGLVSAHLWFALATPQDGAALMRWAAALNSSVGHKAVDSATLNAIQAHYTGAPVFGAGLHDPLKGRRTVLVRGVTDAARLDIPPETPRQTSSTGHGTLGVTGLGFAQRLELIGHPERGFHAAINGAIASYISSNWPEPDSDKLVELLRARILAADPGGRSQAEIDRYADPANLRARIDWTIDRQREKAEVEQAQRAAAEAVEATFPDRSVSLAQGQRLAAEAVDRFADRLRAGEKPEMLLRVTVGSGKSEAAIAGAVQLLEAAREGGGEAAADSGLVYLVPRHDLGGEIVERLRAAHPGRAVAVWRGMDADDPQQPGKSMCLDDELPKAAAAAGLAAGDACVACPLNGSCGYRRQRAQRAEIWVAAHQTAFRTKPKALPAAGVVVFDEAFWSGALVGQDGTRPPQLALSALADLRTVLMAPQDRERLFYLRHLAQRALDGHEPGGLRRDAFIATGMTAEMAREWLALEWANKPSAKLGKEALPREVILERLQEAAAVGFSRLRPILAKFVAELLEDETAARSVNVTFDPDADLGREQGTGPALQFSWREDFADWAAEAPKLLLDATTSPELARVWAPSLEVVDIEVAAPMQRVRQVADREFGRSFFVQNAGNVSRLADLVVTELAAAGTGDVLVVAQEAVETLLRNELRRRLGDELPGRLHLAHHGAVTGMDSWRHVSRLLVVGRPALNRLAGERLAEIVAGRPIARMQDGEAALWPTAPAGIRLAEGTGRPVQQPRHADPLVEAIRWSVSEGAVIQALGRARGVRRAEPVAVTILGALALPVTVTEVTTWAEALPDRLVVAAAEAGLTGRALPLAPADLPLARPDLWATPKAAERFYETAAAAKTPRTLIEGINKGSGGFNALAGARYRKANARRWSWALVPPADGRAALEAILGPVAAFEPAAADALFGEPPHQALPPAPEPVPAADARVAPAPADANQERPPPDPFAPSPAGSRLVVLGLDPPLDAPTAAPPPQSRPAPRGRCAVQLVRPPSPAARLAALSARLEAARPPRLWNDWTDAIRIEAWRTRRAAAARPPDPAAARSGGGR